MKKETLISCLFILGLLILNFTEAAGYYILAEDTTGVKTDRGTVTLLKNTIIDIDGDYSTNIATLTEGRTLTTTQGPIYFPEGTTVDCDPPEPGYPDNCNLS